MEELKARIEIGIRIVNLERELKRRYDEIKKNYYQTIRVMGETAFDSGKSDIRPEMIPLLEKIGSALRGRKGEIIVCGHTDNVPVKSGPFKSNLRLSIARAATVAEFLINRTMIEPSRISTMGFGEYRPLVSNDTPEERQKNRRMEITLTTSAFQQQTKAEAKTQLPVYKPTNP
jgi:chemotaxis protein MotB